MQLGPASPLARLMAVGEARFFEATDLTDEDVAALEQTIRS